MQIRKAIVLGAALLFCGGCGQQALPDKLVSGTASQKIIDENLTVVGVAQVGSESDWRIAQTESIRSALTQENGFYLIFEDGQQKQENQIKAMRNFILQEVDYIVLDPIVESGWDGVLQEAKDAGIPVIVADRMVESDDSLYTCWVGSDFVKEGEDAGRWLEAHLKKQGREKEDIRIVTLQGTLGSSAQLGRTTGFGNILRQNKNWIMLETVCGEFVQAKGQEAMETLLEKYDDIDVLISENDNMTFGAIEAIRNAGRSCGVDGDIIILSFDGVKAMLEAMVEGKVNVDFECNPLIGPKLVEILDMLKVGEAVDNIQYMDETYFDTNMDLESIIETRAY